MPTYTTDAIVLGRRNLGEHDRILTLLTRDYGKLNAVAKGARKGNSKLSGATEPFTQLKLMLATGRSLDIISQCEISNSHPALRSDIGRLTRSSYLCDLLDCLIHERDETSIKAIYDLSVAALSLLEKESVWKDSPLHGFEFRLLTILGYMPVLNHCVLCDMELSDQMVAFSASQGGVLCPQHASAASDHFGISADTLQTLQDFARVGTEKLCNLNPGPQSILHINRVLREFMKYHSERTIKSIEFLESIRAMGN